MPPTASPPAQPNLLLVEDDPHFAHWAALALQAAKPELRPLVAPSLATARQAWAHPPATGWRLAIVDLNLGPEQGATFIAEITAQAPQLPVLVLTSVDTPDKALEAIRAGAQGYILKSTMSEELLRGVEQVLAGGSPITPSIARQLLTEFRQTGAAPATPAPAAGVPESMLEKLSQREVDVLRLLARGYTDKEAAQQLDIAPTTVDTHVRKIYRKLSINSRVELRRLLA
ncbi:LuxR C-terminal-related transcriptional regulator [Ideonella livida]|uniref:Response regulator transcription factor n=1 Tax=Ideonella livida TaxID=2707176 RepID=A0A7C9PK38_9BURK|nr:response regulator transcription factor [Ideonella livida]NDY94035.1 response regulator transcription factor [Ideonella livida]